MKLAILGTRGIPNNYGGFEQVTEFLSAGLAARGHEVFVYCSHNHPYQGKTWNGIRLLHCYDGEKHLNTAGQFIYDLNCIRDAAKRNFDVLLFMGYTSSSVWGRWFPKKPVIISNMDGLEWKRKKYSRPVQGFLKFAERLAVKHSQYHIADSLGIKQHLDNTYGIESCFIPYGAKITSKKCLDVLPEYGLEKNLFNLLIARMEPENNIEMVLDGYAEKSTKKHIVVVGNMTNGYGRKIRSKYKNVEGIIFTGPLFDQEKLNGLRTCCNLYFHGHSVGGTNPSLLEAMASGAVVAAHDNIFNRSVLGREAFYFSNAGEVAELMHRIEKNDHAQLIKKNMEKIQATYNWDTIVDQYEQFITSTLNQKGNV